MHRSRNNQYRSADMNVIVGRLVTDCIRRKGRYDEPQSLMNMLQNLDTTATAHTLR